MPQPSLTQIQLQIQIQIQILIPSGIANITGMHTKIIFLSAKFQAIFSFFTKYIHFVHHKVH